MNEKSSWLEQPVFPAWPALTREILIFALILLVAIVSRFADLGARVMSHDESLHTYFSWLLYRGQGYQHSPMMHGPFQFHLLALIYFLFGDSDFTARIPAALFSIATVAMLWYWRRYLGRAGALIAAAMMVISPYMLFYGRYVRNEAFVGLFGLLMLYAMLRYLETGERRYTYLLTLAAVLHFCTKETSFIYTAQALLFLAIYLLARVTRAPWQRSGAYTLFLVLLMGALLLTGAAAWAHSLQPGPATLGATETAAPADPSLSASPLAPQTPTLTPALLFGALAALLYLGAAATLIYGYTWQALRAERSFALAILLGTFVLPQLTPFPVKFAGWNPLDYSQTGILHTAYFLVPILLISIAIGLLWDRELWIKNAILFYAIFTVLYTTVFTNGAGFFSGLIGSLGYWIEQQGVQRGSQPWYYYLLVQIPVYEFLPALTALLAGLIGLARLARRPRLPAPTPDQTPAADPAASARRDALLLLGWWSVTSLIAFTLAGERMPWLTYHITLPMILLGGWGVSQVWQGLERETLRERRPALVLLLTLLFIISLGSAVFMLLGERPPFQGKDLEQLSATSGFLFAAAMAIGSAVLLGRLLTRWPPGQYVRLATLAVLALLGVQTLRAAYMANYMYYDEGREYLVYAHGARGVKDVMEQVESISRRLYGDLSLPIAYDASAPDTGVSWPVVWYLRNYNNYRAFDVPTRALRDSVVVIVDQKNFDRIEAALGPGYQRMDTIRMVWPNQDYFSLSYPRNPQDPFYAEYPCKGLLGVFRLFKSRDFSRLCNMLGNPAVRTGLFQIWLNRDYSLYASATGNNYLTLTTWEPSDKMRLYIRNDVVQQIWQYGVPPSLPVVAADPYEGKYLTLAADKVLGFLGSAPGQFNAPRAIAFAPDGSFYVADSRNHRIQRFAADGTFLKAWGTFADAGQGNAPMGTFNEPWGVAVGPDGSVYVADTWNYRIQKFSADGVPLRMWGSYGLGDRVDSFYGPRGIAVDSQGRVFVADTGNKRIVVFDENGRYLTQFGGAGMEPGQLDEPVGVFVDGWGYVYVSDTWNQRVQVFMPALDGNTYYPLRQWDVAGWQGQSIENKPFLAVDALGRVFVTDPEGYRVIQFAPDGTAERVWGAYGFDLTDFGLPSGIAVAPDGAVWVTDAGNHRLMRFTLPETPAEAPSLEGGE